MKILRVAILLVVLISMGSIVIGYALMHDEKEFSGEQAYIFAKQQMEMGPRTPGSTAHEDLQVWANDKLSSYGWEITLQQGKMLGHPLTNIIAQKGAGEELIVIGAHYDSRLNADKDDKTPHLAVPGANDGASGVAVLMELARTLNIPPGKQVWLVFFDLEDQGKISPDWDWILGSTYFSTHLAEDPDAVVIVDMIGDRKLNIKKELSSDSRLNDQIWSIAEQKGYGEIFVDAHGYGIMDDHTPFLQKGIPAVDLIDFDYPYWHTTQDTLDKISPDSLQAVGEVLQAWIEE